MPFRYPAGLWERPQISPTLCPFELSAPAVDKLHFVNEVASRPGRTDSRESGHRPSVDVEDNLAAGVPTLHRFEGLAGLVEGEYLLNLHA